MTRKFGVTSLRERLTQGPIRSRSLLGRSQGASIPAKVVVLDNGLTVAAHRDPKVPVVAVHVAYHVGSRDEARSKAGLAHLFEHLMFSGTASFPGNIFLYLEGLGATSINAVSREDYTAYFEVVPVEALDATLALEAGRMRGSLSGLLEVSEFDRQREVVRNELLQREAEPYGTVNRLIAQHVYARVHPYWHPADGLVEDLDNISMADAADWYGVHYGPANAILVIAGDVEPQAAIRLARRHFESIPPGSPLVRQVRSIAKLETKHRLASEDGGAGRICIIWNVPEFGSPEHTGLELASEVLAGGVTSRLSRILIDEQRLASDVYGEVRARELGSQVVIWATTRPGVAGSALESGLRAELGRFCRLGPTAEEVNLGGFRRFAKLVREIERVSGPRSKSELLAIGWLLAGDASAHEKRLAQIVSIRPSEIRALARIWLHDDAAFVLEVGSSQSGRPLRRTQAQALSRLRPRAFQPIEVARRSRVEPQERLAIIAISRQKSPLFEFRLIVDGGFCTDPPDKNGLAGVALAASTDGSVERGRVSVAARLEQLGAQIEGHVRLDASVVRLSALGFTLDASLKLLAGTILHPRIDDVTTQRAKESRQGLIAREKCRPLDLAMRILPELTYRPVAPICAANDRIRHRSGCRKGLCAGRARVSLALARAWRSAAYRCRSAVRSQTDGSGAARVRALSVLRALVCAQTRIQRRRVRAISRSAPRCTRSVTIGDLCRAYDHPKKLRNRRGFNCREHSLGRFICVTLEHEPSRGEGLVVRRALDAVECAGPRSLARVYLRAAQPDRCRDVRDHA